MIAKNFKSRDKKEKKQEQNDLQWSIPFLTHISKHIKNFASFLFKNLKDYKKLFKAISRKNWEKNGWKCENIQNWVERRESKKRRSPIDQRKHNQKLDSAVTGETRVPEPCVWRTSWRDWRWLQLLWRQDRLNPRSTLPPSRVEGRVAHRGDNGGAKPGDLQGPRRLVGSLFQRQLCRETYHQNSSLSLFSFSLHPLASFLLYPSATLLGVAEKKVVKLGAETNERRPRWI